MPNRPPTNARGTSFDPARANANTSTALSGLSALNDPLGIGQGSEAPAPADIVWGPNQNMTLQSLLGRLFNVRSFKEPLRLTSGDPSTGQVQFHGERSGTPFEASGDDIMRLLKQGMIAEPGAGPEGASVESLVRRLLKMLPKE